MSIVKEISDRDLRVVVACGLIGIASDGHGRFPSVNLKPGPEIITRLNEVIRPWRGGTINAEYYEFCGDEKTRRELSQMTVSREGYLTGVTS